VELMIAAAEMTEKQQRAAAALEGARSAGMTLSEYARKHGLVLRELFNGIAALRRKGVLAKSQRKRTKNGFVAIRVVENVPPAASSRTMTPLCRIVRQDCVIECLQWPPPSWLAALTPGASDAAS
jgi:hypothetical protein